LAKAGCAEWKRTRKTYVVIAGFGVENALKTSPTESHGAKHVNYSLKVFALKL